MNEKIKCKTDCGEVEEIVHKPKLGMVDQFQAKIISRKLLVFIAATCLLIWSTLDPETWAMIAVIYIGGQSAIDIAKVWKGLV